MSVSGLVWQLGVCMVGLEEELIAGVNKKGCSLYETGIHIQPDFVVVLKTVNRNWR